MQRLLSTFAYISTPKRINSAAHQICSLEGAASSGFNLFGFEEMSEWNFALIMSPLKAVSGFQTVQLTGGLSLSCANRRHFKKKQTGKGYRQENQEKGQAIPWC
jgi:hypothetical protein